MSLPDELVAMLRRPSTCYLATLMPDGSPQLTQTWVDTDGENVIINSVETHMKARNIARDPRVALTVSDPSDPTTFFQVRGEVVNTTTEGAEEHVERLSQRYLNRPYPRFTGGEEVRVMFMIAPEKVSRTPAQPLSTASVR
ncbi:putative oxidoreductase [Nocardia brasiliensis NBRC 14402]|uniref:PPOX class F420-dependent oxidoreductase n=1 Tax=Nocardia brasiliensis TaxID=37326 RepID=UPI00045C4939|nr:PPOX class F420-dependent oxidoreductase [Nocardia brasiliensis]ASF09472.1 PPOX class F420-dependent oxidoreductase [Nocardia brasiliensis]GAJ86588.1 putative oxidoreductase [Nocardia brasiliensis NBRC 14402]SUB39817.1 PPOX class probable F420-dependent enzyme [Nocardia brasiliensis]